MLNIYGYFPDQTLISGTLSAWQSPSKSGDFFEHSAEVQEYWHNMSMGLVRCPSGCAMYVYIYMYIYCRWVVDRN